MPKKPKMVGCSTLMKRLNEAGLGHLYKLREVHVMPDEELFMEEEMGPLPMMGPCSMDQVYRGGSCMNIADLDEDQCTGDDLMWNKSSKKCGRKSKDMPSLMPISIQMGADPACDAEFQALAQKQPNNLAQAKFLKEYKGYSMGPGPCNKRQLVPRYIHGNEDDVIDYAEVAGFDMNYGRRYMSGARPKKSQKHVGAIIVNGKSHHVFKGKEGGLYYLKGKTGRKVYVDKERLRKRKSRFGNEEEDEEDEEEMEFGRRYMSGARPKKSQKHVGAIIVKGRSHHVFKGKEGGLYYLKGKTGRKVYIDKERLRK